MAIAPNAEQEGGPRGAIMSVAMHLFGKQGFTGTSMRDIANAVGLLPGSLYAHIQSKEALLLSIVSDGIGRFLAAVEPLATMEGSPAERLRKMIVAHVEVVADNPERSQVVFHQWRFLGDGNLPVAVERRRQYESLFISVVQQGIASGEMRSDIDLRIEVRTILGALNWTPEWFSPDGELGAAEVGKHMANTLLRGILT